MTTRYYLLIGTAEPVAWTVDVASESEIIARAGLNARQREGLEFLAGFELVGTGKRAGSIGVDLALAWSRDWMPGEKFNTSLLKLGDDGRIFKAFDTTDPAQTKDFLEQAEAAGLRYEIGRLPRLSVK